VEETLEQELRDAAAFLRDEYNLKPNHLMRLIRDVGGVVAVRSLLRSNNPDRLIRLQELERLDMSVENTMLDPRFSDLFNEEERTHARKRLESLGFTPDEEE